MQTRTWVFWSLAFHRDDLLNYRVVFAFLAPVFVSKDRHASARRAFLFACIERVKDVKGYLIGVGQSDGASDMNCIGRQERALTICLGVGHAAQMASQVHDVRVSGFRDDGALVVVLE